MNILLLVDLWSIIGLCNLSKFIVSSGIPLLFMPYSVILTHVFFIPFNRCLAVVLSLSSLQNVSTFLGLSSSTPILLLWSSVSQLMFLNNLFRCLEFPHLYILLAFKFFCYFLANYTSHSSIAWSFFRRWCFQFSDTSVSLLFRFYCIQYYIGRGSFSEDILRTYASPPSGRSGHS